MDPASLKPAIDVLVEPMVATRTRLGMVVGVITPEGSEVFGYGKTSEANSGQPDAHTLFEIGSITKVFTSTLLATMVVDGLARLDEPVRDLLPQAAALPREITLERLATHSSGLPRLPRRLFWLEIRERRNPYASYSLDELYRYLARYKGNARAVGKLSYSNLGAGLLGNALAHRLGMPYEDAVSERICKPLGLSETAITLAPELRARLAGPHNAKGTPWSNWDIPAFAGAGALRSTAHDVLAFLAHNLHPSRSPIGPALELCQQRRHEGPPKSGLGIGLGWFIEKAAGGDLIHTHNGATGGYRAYAAFWRDCGWGVVALANHGPNLMELLFPARRPTVDTVGSQVLKRLASDTGQASQIPRA